MKDSLWKWRFALKMSLTSYLVMGKRRKNISMFYDIISTLPLKKITAFKDINPMP